MISFSSMIPEVLDFNDTLSEGKYAWQIVASVLEHSPDHIIYLSTYRGVRFSKEVINKAFELYDVPQ